MMLPSEGFDVLPQRKRAALARYHHHYDSGLLLLRRRRSGLGRPTRAEGVRRLVDRVGAAPCDPDIMARASGGWRQELPSLAQFPVGLLPR
jgi:hypothetical protein